MRHVRVAVIGAGFGGLGMAVRLRGAGITDFVVLERAGSVGGTWRDNSYPGCACDIPSHLYSFSFAPNPHWPRSYSAQPAIRAYLEDITDRFGLRPHLRFDCEVLAAHWDAGRRRWLLRSTGGELSCDVLVAAPGALSEPAVPDLPGLASFPGPVFHSARWDHGAELAGARVAMVGTGASAIQIVPAIAPAVDRLLLFQRTPAWVLPRRDRAFTGWEQRLYERVPLAQQLARGAVYATKEAAVGGFIRRPGLLRVAQAVARRHLYAQVADPALRARLTPDYRIGCKRILLSNDYYPALTRPGVELVPAGVAEVRGRTLVAADGTARDADVIVFGTGFRVTEMPIAARLFGSDGRSLATTWGGSARALRGTTVAGFPNLFLLLGPNTGLGHSSMVYMIESQLNYVLDGLRRMDAAGLATIEATGAAQRRWNDEVQRRMVRTVWTTGGCQSWYLDATGRNSTLWPAETWRFRRATRRVDLGEYRVTRAAAPAAVPAVPATPEVTR